MGTGGGSGHSGRITTGQKAGEEMRKDGSDDQGLPLKAFLALIAAAAVALGLALPVPHRSESAPKSQFATLELGR